MTKRETHAALRRLDETRLEIENTSGVPITLFASSAVHVEADAVDQILEFVKLEDSLRASFGDVDAHLRRIVLTPDFHRGSGIPVGTVAEADGFVVPRAIGTDINCGMRLIVTDLTRAELEGSLDRLPPVLRAIFFEGKRDLPMSPRQREAMLREGLVGVAATADDNANTGLWRWYRKAQAERDLTRTHFGGALPTRDVFAFDDYIRGSGANDSRDAQLGSIGGGNHFVELQVVDEICDGAVARIYGAVEGRIAIMVHSGSVSLGQAVGSFFNDEAKRIWPTGHAHPDNGFYPLPTRGPHAAVAMRYLDAMRNAANFAFANRLFLGLMAVRGLEEIMGREIGSQLLYDAPHNLVWEPSGERTTYVHRKGACPAPGPDPAGEGPFRWAGTPVIIPGSMGASSYVLAGSGEAAAMESACHGAGRAMTRNQARAIDEKEAAASLQKLRVVTPIDPDSPTVRRRRDIVTKHTDRLKEEAPYAYKDVTPIIETVAAAGIARPVARLWPLLTIKA